MPLAISSRAACAQIHVALNGQQYADTGTFFRFNEYCSGKYVLTDPRGVFGDHPVSRQGSGPPRPYSFCKWIITVAIADVINDPQPNDQINLALQVVRACPPPIAACTSAAAAHLPQYRASCRRASVPSHHALTWCAPAAD